MSLAPDLLKSDFLNADLWKSDAFRDACRKLSPTLIAASLAGSIVLIAMLQGVTDGRLYGAATVIGAVTCLMLEAALLLRHRWRPALAWISERR